MDPTATKGKEELWALRAVIFWRDGRRGKIRHRLCGLVAAQQCFRVRMRFYSGRRCCDRLHKGSVRGVSSCATLDLEMPLLGRSAQAQRQCGTAALTRLRGWYEGVPVLGATLYEQLLPPLRRSRPSVGGLSLGRPKTRGPLYGGGMADRRTIHGWLAVSEALNAGWGSITLESKRGMGSTGLSRKHKN